MMIERTLFEAGEYAEGDDDGTFFGYSPSTVDPGNTVLFSTLLCCLILTVSLPIMVFLCQKEEAKLEDELINGNNNKNTDRSQYNAKVVDENDNESHQSQLQQEETNKNESQGVEVENVVEKHEEAPPPSAPSLISDVLTRRSEAASLLSSVGSSLLNHPKLHKTRAAGGGKRHRRKHPSHSLEWEKEIEYQRQKLGLDSLDQGEVNVLNMHEIMQGHCHDNDNLSESRSVSDSDSESQPRLRLPLEIRPLEKNHPHHDSCCSSVSSRESSLIDKTQFSLISTPPAPQCSENRGDGMIHDDPSVSRSLLAIPIGAAAGDFDPIKEGGTGQYGSRFLLELLLSIPECDREMNRIIQLALPFSGQALCTGILDVMRTGVIGRLMGTRELAAYVVVTMYIELSSTSLGGLHESLTTLCSQAVGAGKPRLAGQYVQLSVALYYLLAMPWMIFWAIYISPAIAWLGFDTDIVTIGRDYAYVLLLDQFIINGISESIHSLLDVSDHEYFSMYIGVAEEVMGLVLIFLFAMFGEPTLQDIGLLECGLGIVFLILNVVIVCTKGWFKKFYSGFFGSVALFNVSALKLMASTSLSLSLGHLLVEGEWEVLALIAKSLGPAEVAVWGVLGTLWGAVEMFIESIGDAAEVRCAVLLGAGQPHKARLSAYKSIFIAFFLSVIVTAGVFAAGESIPTWITHDAALQHMLVELLPLFGIGNICLTVGSVSWAILGSQGRYQLATAVAFFASVCVTMPLAAVYSILLNVNLQGQTAAVIIGYMVSGTINSYFLFRSNWDKLSEEVIRQALENDEDDSSDDSSSDDSDDDDDNNDAGGASDSDKSESVKSNNSNAGDNAKKKQSKGLLSTFSSSSSASSAEAGGRTSFANNNSHSTDESGSSSEDDDSYARRLRTKK